MTIEDFWNAYQADQSYENMTRWLKHLAWERQEAGQ